MGALVEKVVGQMYPSTPIPPLGLSPRRPLGMTVRVLPGRKNFPTHGPWDRVVCEPVTGLTAMKNGCHFGDWRPSQTRSLNGYVGCAGPQGRQMGRMGAARVGLGYTEVRNGCCARLH